MFDKLIYNTEGKRGEFKDVDEEMLIRGMLLDKTMSRDIDDYCSVHYPITLSFISIYGYKWLIEKIRGLYIPVEEKRGMECMVNTTMLEMKVRRKQVNNIEE